MITSSNPNDASEKLCLDDKQLKAEVDNKRLSLKNAIPQVAASVAALSAWFCTGVGIGFSAVLLPRLAANVSSIPVTEDQASWIASLLPLSTGLGALIAAYLVDAVGRRDTTKIQMLPILMSWAVMAWAGHVEALYVSRILIGVATGMCMISTMYVTEVAHPALRGALCNLALLWASAGNLSAYILGTVLPWRLAASVCGVFPLLTFVALCFVPESPRWLLAVRRKADAEKAVNWFYSKDPEIAALQWHALLLEDTSSEPKLPLARRLRLLLRPGALKPLGVLFGFFVFQQLSGVYVLLFYTVDLFQRVGSGLDPFVATILVGVVRMTTSGAAVAASRRVGRRPLAMCSGLGMAATMATAGTCLYVGGENNSTAGWVSLTCVLLYMFASAMGFLCLPWSMTGELLPLDMRGVGGGLCNTANHLLMFAVLKAYPHLADLLHGFGVLFFFAISSLLGALFVFLFLPETFGKTLPEIEQHFERNLKIPRV